MIVFFVFLMRAIYVRVNAGGRVSDLYKYVQSKYSCGRYRGATITYRYKQRGRELEHKCKLIARAAGLGSKSTKSVFLIHIKSIIFI